MLDVPLGRLVSQPVPTTINQANQRLQSNPQSVSDLALPAAAGLRQPNGPGFKFDSLVL